MNWRSLAHFLLLSLPAAAFGSAAGTLALAAYELLPCGRCFIQPHVDAGPVAALTLVSLIGTYPGALLLGVPVAYPLRHRIAARPRLWALPMIAIGMIVSSVALGWAFVSPVTGRLQDIAILWPYGGATALGFVLAIAWRARRDTLEPA